MSVFRATTITWRTSFAEARGNRRAFWFQIVAMLLNDGVWILFWLFFFQRFGSVRGWEFSDMIVLYSVLTASAGMTVGLLANSRLMGRLIADGELDAALTLPIPTLPYLLARRIDVVFVGDALFGVALFLTLGRPTPTRALIFVTCSIASTLILTGFLVLVGSAAFVFGRSEIGDFGFHLAVLFASYPIDLFGGPARLFLYLVVPAGFISGVPVRLMNDFDWRWAAAIAAAAAFFVWTGTTAFQRGLRRYTSGSVWTDG